MAEISLKRLSDQRVDRHRAYKILVDGQKVGHISSGETKVFEVQPGEHEVQLKIDWCSSDTLEVDLASDGTATFLCKPRASQRSRTKLVLEGIYLITVGRKRYIDLYPDDQENPQQQAEVSHPGPEV